MEKKKKMWSFLTLSAWISFFGFQVKATLLCFARAYKFWIHFHFFQVWQKAAWEEENGVNSSVLHYVNSKEKCFLLYL